MNEVNDICDKIREDMQHLLGKRVTPTTKEDVARAFSQSVPEGYSVQVSSLWESFPVWKKSVWVLSNVIIFPIGWFKRQAVKEETISRLAENPESFSEEVFVPTPWWAVRSPKSLIVCDAILNIPLPLKSIEFTFKGEKTK